MEVTPGMAGVLFAMFVQAVGFAAWLGALSNEVKRLKEDVSKHSAVNDTVIELRVLSTQTKEKLESLDDGMTNLNRQMATMVQRGLEKIETMR